MGDEFLSNSRFALLRGGRSPLAPGTRRVDAATLRQLREHLGAAVAVATLDHPVAAKRLDSWFADRWGSRAPATFNRNLDAIRSALGYWQDQDWITIDPSRALRRRASYPSH